MQIKQLELKTSALKQLSHFYSMILELPVENEGETEITIHAGNTQLVFQQVSTAAPVYHFAINIPSNKIEEARVWLSNRVDLIWIEQYKSEVADFVNWHAKSIYFFDPAGNILELISRLDLENKTDEPFSSLQFIAISEVALVCKEDEMEKMAVELIRQYQLPWFDKQPPLPQFKAIGDDEGLFIIVPENRSWFPTTIPSGIYPIQIEFENEGKGWKLKV